MVEIDCGREYLALDDFDKVNLGYTFAVELLDNRLRKAGYAGAAEQLIGKSDWPEGNLAKALVSSSSGHQRDSYHGLNCIAAVCSGDVSTLLLIYRKMFEGGRVDKYTTRRISKSVQSGAIQEVSRDMLGAIEYYFPKGPEMHSVVSSFGNLVRNILYQGREQKKGDTTVPTECPRIEIDQPQGSVYRLLSSEQGDLARELVRRAIFIDMESGRSRHRNVTTLRWQLRRVYLPAFGASLAKNNAVKGDSALLQYFLSDPEEACRMITRKWPTEDVGSEVLPGQLPMLGIDGPPGE